MRFFREYRFVRALRICEATRVELHVGKKLARGHEWTGRGSSLLCRIFGIRSRCGEPQTFVLLTACPRNPGRSTLALNLALPRPIGIAGRSQGIANRGKTLEA